MAQQIQSPVVPTADGSCTLTHPVYQETYHSRYGAVGESRHVYVQGSSLREMLRSGRKISLLEFGFGTGLNFLLSADAASEYPSSRLEYTGIDNRFLPKSIIKKLSYERFLGHPQIIGIFQGYSEQKEKQELVTQNIRLILCKTDFLSFSNPDLFDIIYYDVFSFSVQPEVWGETMLFHALHFLVPGGLLVTYCAKSSVKKFFRDAGCDVFILPGYDGKREMLLVRK